MSDYFHGGTGLSGMFCFRDSREAYGSVRSKDDYVRLVPDAISECVDELYVCRQFEAARAGYRLQGLIDLAPSAVLQRRPRTSRAR